MKFKSCFSSSSLVFITFLYFSFGKLEFLDYEEVPFRSDANIGHLCNNLNNIVGKGIWYDTFQVQNTK